MAWFKDPKDKIGTETEQRINPPFKGPEDDRPKEPRTSPPPPPQPPKTINKKRTK